MNNNIESNWKELSAADKAEFMADAREVNDATPRYVLEDAKWLAWVDSPLGKAEQITAGKLSQQRRKDCQEIVKPCQFCKHENRVDELMKIGDIYVCPKCLIADMGEATNALTKWAKSKL